MMEKQKTSPQIWTNRRIGITGAQGATGAQGSTGAQGATGMTGTQGATIRVYLERYVASDGNLGLDPQNALADLISGINSMVET